MKRRCGLLKTGIGVGAKGWLLLTLPHRHPVRSCHLLGCREPEARLPAEGRLTSNFEQYFCFF
jgi:hypothetical protein